MSKLTKADHDALCSLHGELARVLTKAIQNPGEDGPQAAILSVARQFLKDNKIEAVPVKGSPLGELADLPVFDNDDFGKPDGYHQ